MDREIETELWKLLEELKDSAPDMDEVEGRIAVLDLLIDLRALDAQHERRLRQASTKGK